MTEAEAMEETTVDQAREEALAEYRSKLLSHKEVDAQVSRARARFQRPLGDLSSCSSLSISSFCAVRSK